MDITKGPLEAAIHSAVRKALAGQSYWNDQGIRVEFVSPEGNRVSYACPERCEPHNDIAEGFVCCPLRPAART